LTHKKHSLRILTRFILPCVLVLMCQSVVAAERLVFENFLAYKSQGVYKMDVDTHVRIRKSPAEALKKGISLYFTMNISVVRQRNWWPDSTESMITRYYRLFYFDLARHYRVTEITSGETQSFLTLEEAINNLGKIRGLPLIPIDHVIHPIRYRVHLQMSLDISELPAPLQLQAYTTHRWLLRSEDTQWPLE